MTLVAAAAALVSCTREETEVNDQTEFVYRFELVEGETKATLDNEGVWWEADDHVGVIVGNQNIRADVVESEGKKVISFTSESAIEEGTPIYSYYPYSAAVTSAAEAQVTIPTEQEGGSVSAMPMAGIPIELESAVNDAFNGRINFLNLGSIIDFRVYSTNADYANETVESISFNAPGMAVSGTATLDLIGVSYDETGKTVTVPEMTMAVGEGSSSATVTQQVGVAASKTDAATPTYLVVAPGTYTGTIVVNTNAASYTFSFENREFKRNGLRKYNLNLNNATREALTKTYTLVTNTLSAGTYILVSDDSSEAYNNPDRYTVALFPTVVTTSWSGTSPVQNGQRFDEKDVTLSGDSVTTDDPEIVGAEIELVASGSGWKIKAKATGEYLVAPTGSYCIPLSTDASDAAVFTISTAQNRSITVGGYYFFHSGSATGFTIRNTGSTVSNIRFYTLSGSSKSQTLSFGETTEFEWDLTNEGEFVEPKLDGAKTSVTYSSNKTQIATVDEDGNVTFNTNHMIGTVTITAHAAADNGYAAAEASYVIHVTDANLPTTTYYKASALETPATTVENPYTYMIVSASGSKYYALQNNEGDLDATEVTVASNQIVMPEDETLLWTATAVSGNNYGTHSLRNGETYLTRNSSNLQGGTGSTGNYVVWRYDGEDLWNGNSTNYFVYYDSGWKLASGNAGNANAALYTSRAPRTVTFTPTAAEYDIAHPEDFVTPTLNGADGATVTYKSSDENVATVASDGTLTVLKKTTTPITITATIAPTADYQGTTASYTLTVINSEDHPVTYYKASTADSGYDYIIVSNGQALQNSGDNNVPTAVPVSVSENNTIELTDVDDLLWRVTNLTSTSNYGDFTMTNGGVYLYRKTSNNGTTLICEETSSANYVPWRYDGNHLWNGNTTSYYALYDSGWTINTSEPTINTWLFTARLPQSLAFSETAKTYDLYTGQGFDEPELSGVQTSVTYSSSNPAIATVTASSGEVEPVAVGTVIITATAASSTQYQGATASYTITVSDSSPKARNLQFSASTYSVAVNDSPNPPILSGDKIDDVTYTSSNTAVAEVDSSTGALTLHTEGQTRITASASAVAGWQAGSAYYDLTVTAALPTVTYTKVMSGSELAEDDVILFVYENGASSKVFKPILNSSKNAMQVVAANAVAAAVDNNQIVSAQLASCQITLKNRDANGPKFSMLVPKADGTTDYYFRINNATLSAQTADPGYRPTFTINDGALSLVRSNYYLRYSATNSYFESSTSTPSNMAVYKIDDGQPKARDLAFSEPSMSVNIYGKSRPYTLTGTPTLTGKGLDDVTFAVSDNEGVASVDKNSGDVTLEGGTGTVTITASAPATDDFLSDSASYTLTVTNTPPPTYTMATEITVGATYLIVSKDDDKVFTGAKAGTASNVAPVEGVITDASGDFAGFEFTVEENEGVYYLKFNDGKYLVCDYNNTYGNSTSGLRYVDSQSAVTYPYVLSVTDTYGFCFSTTKMDDANSTDQVLYYKTGTGTGSKIFKIGQSGRNVGVHLYKKD